MESKNYMSRKEVRAFLREKAKELGRKSDGKTRYYVKGITILAKPKHTVNAKPTVIYDHSVEKRKVGN